MCTKGQGSKLKLPNYINMNMAMGNYILDLQLRTRGGVYNDLIFGLNTLWEIHFRPQF